MQRKKKKIQHLKNEQEKKNYEQFRETPRINKMNQKYLHQSFLDQGGYQPLQDRSEHIMSKKKRQLEQKKREQDKQRELKEL